MATCASEGAVRAAETAISTNGGFAAMLQLSGVAVSGSDVEQLGLTTPQFQEIALFPAAWRRFGFNDVLLVGASAVTQAMGAQDLSSAVQLFESATGVVVGDVLYRITGCEALMAGGVACAYKLMVQAPAWA